MVHVNLHARFEQESSGEWVCRFVYDDSTGKHEEGTCLDSFPTREALAAAFDAWLKERIERVAATGPTLVEWNREPVGQVRELTIGIDEAGHVCKRSGFLRAGTEQQMETMRHIDYLLDEMGAWQDETEGGPEVRRLEAVTGWQLRALIAQLKAGRA